MVNRKKFIRLASMSFGTLMVPGILSAGQLVSQGSAINKDLAAIALKAARSNGASYADVRIGNYSQQVGSAQSYGICIRVLVNGAWGYAATGVLTGEAIIQCAVQAVASAIATGKSSPIPKRHQYDLKCKHDSWSVAVFR